MLVPIQQNLSLFSIEEPSTIKLEGLPLASVVIALPLECLSYAPLKGKLRPYPQTWH
jgi:hypothetical protein